MALTPETTLDLAHLQAVMDALPIAIYVKDPHSRMLLMNQACEDAVGEPFGNLFGTLGERYYTPEQQARCIAHDQQTFASGRTVRYEEYYWNAVYGQRRWGQTVTKPVYDAQGEPLYLVGTTVDINAQKQLQKQIDSERCMLEMMASSATLTEILDAFARSYEATFSGMICSILLLDADGVHLHNGAGPSLPKTYCDAIEGVAIGPRAGSCGTAAYTGHDTLVTDIGADPLWIDYKDLALAHGLQSCWSIPVRSTKGKMLGTFAIYHATPRAPRNAELLAIQRGAYLTGLAIEHDLAEKQILADQEALREAALHNLTILDNVFDGVITISKEGLIESFNKAATTIFRYTPEEVIGHNVSILMPEHLAKTHDQHLTSHQKSSSTYLIGTRREFQGRRKDGTLFPLSIAVSKITRAGRPTFIGVVHDITQRRRDEEEIRRLAFFDPLTELPNRRLLQDRLRHALVTSARTGQHGAVMFLDLDHFKQINDTCGHDMGDLLLQQVAMRLTTCVREGDSVARLGGDEFVLLLEDLGLAIHDSAAHAEAIAGKILETLGQPYRLREHTYESTPSIGIVVFVGDSESTDDLLKKADIAMYQAKSAGRNTARFFDPAVQASVTAHTVLEHDMRRGLAKQEFMLLYQFQVDVHGTPMGAEALLRWNHTTRGMISPAEFVGPAEESGMGLALGQWVLETACNQLALWADQEATAHWTLAINVSPSQFAQPDFVDRVATVLAKSGANPQRLRLELTENMLMDCPDDTLSRMNAIKHLGVSFALDDFGTGYSSLLHLQRLPLEQLKIDQSFIRDLLSKPEDAAVARSVVALGHSLGMTVIAEGVETAAQRNVLADLGCDAFQGYYFGRPSLASELEKKH